MSLSARSRPSPFTLQEFSDLVSSAFNLSDADSPSHPSHPLFTLSPPSPSASLQSRSQAVFHSETLDDRLQAPPSPNLDTPSRSRTIAALQVLQQLRTRASAFVLRSRAPSPSSTAFPPFQPLPTPSLSPLSPSASSFTRTLSPWSMVDLAHDRPRSRAESLPRSLCSFTKRDTSPPPLPTRHSRSGSSSGTRSPTPVLRSFFDDSPASKRAYSRPSTSSSTHPLSRLTESDVHQGIPNESLPSFFEDTGYQVPNPPAPSYSRPSTPTIVAQQIHSRLPPLRKSKSGGHGVLRRGERRLNSKSIEEGHRVHRGHDDFPLWPGSNSDALSSFAYPRDPPPVPNSAVLPLPSDDAEMPLPPSYVFERRGSATSTSTASTRSSSSLSSRLSNLVGFALPNKLRVRGRSKLNLTVATGSEQTSADSSPSTLSSVSSPSTPSSPTSTFSRSQPYVYPASADGHVWRSSGDSEEEDLSIGRVLTPEADPFAKADITIPVHGTPRPPTPPLSRRGSSQQSPVGLSRTATWDHRMENKSIAVKRTRNSLPASPVSTAYTFPSTCSVYTANSPGRDRNLSPAASTPSTPKRQGPPSAWSPSLSPHPSDTVSNPPSFPKRSSSRASRSSYQRSSPSSSDFPLPPVGLPLMLPSRVLALSHPFVPPVPPKDPVDRTHYAHKSLPPTPRSLSDTLETAGLLIERRGWEETVEDRRTSFVRLPRVIGGCSPSGTVQQDGIAGSQYSLSQQWADAVSRPTTPVLSARSLAKRRSVDSTSTITASPSSSALHEAVRELEGAPPVAASSDRYSSPPSSVKDLDEDADFWSPGASCTTLFYSPRSSLDSGSSFVSCDTGNNHARSLESRPMAYRGIPVRRVGKSASAGPCT